MVDSTTDVLVYLDHNVLDKLTKSQLKTIFTRLSSAKLVPVYSDETLKEISQSKGYEEKFLSLLKELSAAFLRLEFVNNRFTGKAAFENIDPFESYSQYCSNTEVMPELGYGLIGTLHKFYGGLKDKSYSEVMTLGVEEMVNEIEKTVTSMQGDADVIEKDKKIAAHLLSLLKNILPQLFHEMGKTLDQNTAATSVVSQIDEYLSIGPKILNNIKGPDVVKKIWTVIKSRIPEQTLTLEKFFGLTPDFYGPDKRELSIVEKANALYHQLNFLGYYRDAKMSDRAKFSASFSDRSHAGCALFCHYVMSMDEKLIMKSAATYEYLGVFTKTVHLKMQ